jgi:hypothetical protein
MTPSSLGRWSSTLRSDILRLSAGWPVSEMHIASSLRGGPRLGFGILAIDSVVEVTFRKLQCRASQGRRKFLGNIL